MSERDLSLFSLKYTYVRFVLDPFRLLWMIFEKNGIIYLPNDRCLDVTKLKAFADDKLNVARLTISLFDDRVESTVGKGENDGYQHFLLFPQCLPKPSPLGSLKASIVW